MKLAKLTLIITLLGILILTFISQTKPIQTATIKSIQTYPKQTIIKLQNQETELIVFDKLNTNLKQSDKIKFQGKSEIYKNSPQIIIEKISKIN